MSVRDQPESDPLEIAIVGAGISGIGIVIELLRRGCQSLALLEAEETLGGTWRDNTYPGVAVDIPSASYCFSFEADFPWTRDFAPGADVLRYVTHCAAKYDVARHIRYGARVTRSVFTAGEDVWTTHLESGEIVRSRYLIAATGLFTQPKWPDIPDLSSFAGTTMHTARWNHGHDLTNRRVAMIGTGASAVQVAPEVAEIAARLCVFQRTPIWISPRFDRALKPDSRFSLRRLAPIRRLLRVSSEASLEALTFITVNFRRWPFPVRVIAWVVRAWMRHQVHDPDVAARLLPTYGLGCKRPTISNRYLAAFNRPNVSLITQAILRVVPEGIMTDDGLLHQADTLILATGFMTTEEGHAPAFEVVGREGVEPGRWWSQHRRQAYAGVSVPGFPNFFLIAGPYAGGFNWFTTLDAHARHIGACLEEARARGVTAVEVRRDVHDRYMAHMWARADGTVFKDASCHGSRSYYVDRHGDPSLPLPHTPWWRVWRERRFGTSAYQFGDAA
jgi:cation diffusion facilitator CzcD-associated flavoprotein CzcO